MIWATDGPGCERIHLLMSFADGLRSDDHAAMNLFPRRHQAVLDREIDHLLDGRKALFLQSLRDLLANGSLDRIILAGLPSLRTRRGSLSEAPRSI